MTTEEIKAIVKELKKEKEMDIYSKRFLRLDDAAIRYSMSVKKLRQHAYDGNAVIKLNQLVLVDTIALEKFFESFRIVDEGGYSSWLR